MQKKPFSMAVKRLADFLLSLLALAALLPVLLLAALLVYLDSPGPVLFFQKRVGLGGKVFTIVKFRTVRPGVCEDMPTSGLAQEDITRLGAVLRSTSLDELPQIFNILKGDMSVVGPRPLVLCEEDVHSKRKNEGVYQMRPGLTGLAQVNGRDALNDDEKVRYDAFYVRNWSLRLDARILLMTVGKVLRREGVDTALPEKDDPAQSVPETREG